MNKCLHERLRDCQVNSFMYGDLFLPPNRQHPASSGRWMQVLCDFFCSCLRDLFVKT